MDRNQVAKLAGVSSATVSPVNDGAPLVSQQAGDRVRKARGQQSSAPETRIAAAGGSGGSLFGMIIPDPANPFFMELLDAFESIVSAEKHDLIVASAHFDPQHVDACVSRMLMRRIDGLVVAPSELLVPHEAIKRYAVPVVTLDRGEVAERVSDVSVDFENAMIDAIRYLKQMGHRRIAFIGGFPGPKVSQTRIQAFRLALELSELQVDERYIQEGDYRAEGGAAAMSRLLALRSRPTAIVAVNDLTALGALQLLQERGIEVPLQMSIIGFDNIAMSTLVYPTLTTLSISKNKMAQMFFDALMHVRDAKVKRGSLYKLRADLVLRDSVANLNAVRSKSSPV